MFGVERKCIVRSANIILILSVSIVQILKSAQDSLELI